LKEILLISSRILGAGQEKQWIIPQGDVEPWQTPLEAAENEAWEEAGVKGKFQNNPITFFTYSNHRMKYKVFCYSLEVMEETIDWPEKNERSRIWINISEIESKIKNQKLRTVFETFRTFMEKNERKFQNNYI
tara:strand:- start:4 stop:402 length:399 start_codon:yes stop_codon:yes gene_type:complete